MTEFFLACSRPPCLQESAHQTQRDEFLLADENIAHTHADDHGATKVSRCKHSTAQVPLNASISAGSATVRNEPIPASMPTTSKPPRPVRKCSASYPAFFGYNGSLVHKIRRAPEDDLSLHGLGVRQDGAGPPFYIESGKSWGESFSLITPP
ncbi:hypothetical protein C8J57DRAFT_1240217 [Mycena rebaudengoi]|nr:hypothetical protein C8J57DRAFT_1240217 [Mycena rebaudengoi]